MSIRNWVTSLFIISFIPIWAQQSFAIRIHVYDEFLHNEMDGDSLLVTITEVDSTIVKQDISFNMFQSLGFRKRPLIVTFHQDGFQSHTLNIPKPGSRIDYLYLNPIVMKRKPHSRVHELNEVVVTASSIKMINKGDTIVYNADAFQLSQGSMLDELIRALPNVELKEGGRIYVNGQFIESLMLNGKNFFKGNPTIALSNLPSYTVKDVKVYEQVSGYARFDPSAHKPLVMDVNLKKEFTHGWTANAEVGYGTSDRYLDRFFGLLFTPQSRLTIFGNSNNTNDQSTPEDGEQWNPDWLIEGQSRIILGGIDHLIADKHERWEANTTVDVTHETKHLTQVNKSKLYSDNDSLSTIVDTNQQDKLLTANLSHHFKYDYGRWNIYADPSLKYTYNEDNSSYESAMFNFANRLNATSQRNVLSSNTLSGSVGVVSMYSIPNTPDIISLDVKSSFLRKRVNQNGSLDIEYPNTPQLNINRLYNQNNPNDKWDFTVKAGYYARFFINNNARYTTKLSVDYSFSRLSDNKSRIYSIFDVTDVQNTYEAHEIIDNHIISASLSQSLGRNARVHINPYVKYSSRHLEYLKFQAPYFIQRNNLYADPEIDFFCNFLDISYKLTHILPQLFDLLDIVDNINPLYIREGNTTLSPTITNRVTFNPKFIEEWLHSSTRPNIRFSYRNIRNDIGQSLIYNNVTGITIMRPINVQGNWDLSCKINIGYYIDKQRRWLLANNTDYLYQNNHDIVNNMSNEVRCSSLTEKLSLEWSPNFGMKFRAFGSFEWRNIIASTNLFDSNIYNFDYGVSIAAPKLPWGISARTDFTIHSRRGYYDLNDNKAVWNIRLSKSFLKGNLVAMIDGYDILGQLSNVVIDINAHGRTEARYNTLPRYAMLHLLYRLNIQPKKK